MVKRTQVRPPSRFELLPAIDLRGGRVVRLAQGEFDLETVYGYSPAEFGRSFAAAGARWIHVVDLDGARDGARRQTDVIAAIVTAAGKRVGCQVAGGLRDEAAVEAALATGARRAVVGTAALRDPAFVGRVVRRFGRQRVAVALDVREGLAVGEAWIPGAGGIPAEEALVELAGRGARTFIVTAIERDGLLAGPNLELLGRMVRLGRGDIIASAGVSSLGDIISVRAIGCAGAIIGRAIYEGLIDLTEALKLTDAGGLARA
jgi:phosphoribosylformimino-5-aminoimidazole carboxamide ribotide isomerase